jgi:hypothetical protein
MGGLRRSTGVRSNRLLCACAEDTGSFVRSLVRSSVRSFVRSSTWQAPVHPIQPTPHFRICTQQTNKQTHIHTYTYKHTHTHRGRGPPPADDNEEEEEEEEETPLSFSPASFVAFWRGFYGRRPNDNGGRGRAERGAFLRGLALGVGVAVSTLAVLRRARLLGRGSSSASSASSLSLRGGRRGG